MTLLSRLPLLILSLPLAAQAPRMPLQEAPTQTVLIDDDDGRVEVVPPVGVPAPDAVRTFHGGTVLAKPQILTFYLGSAWGTQAQQSPMQRMNERLVAFGVSERFSALKARGLDTFSFPVVNEGIVPTAPGRTVFSDLGIQHFLHGAVKQGQLGPFTEDAIVAVFLAPGLHSTLNGKQDGQAFQAYHSAYHDELGHVRYVVVPFGASEEATHRAAEQAITAAVLNPDGDGWY